MSRARIDAGDLVLKFQGLGLKNQVNWQQGDSGHGGMRQNLNDGPWGCSGMAFQLCPQGLTILNHTNLILHHQERSNLKRDFSDLKQDT